jgi:beta-lactamase regulating signal transducer with metallopeptidase domain
MKYQTQPKSLTLIYGIIYGLLSSITLFILQKFNLDSKGLSSLINFAIATFCILMAVNVYKKTNSNQLTIAGALYIGLLIGIIGGVIYAIYSYFHFDVIFPEYFVEKLATAREEMEKQSTQLTEEQMDQALKISKIIASPAVVSIISFVGALAETCIVGLVIGLFKKSN